MQDSVKSGVTDIFKALVKEPLQQEIAESLQLLQQGYSFSQSVSSRWFPQQAQQMLLVGEKERLSRADVATYRR